MFGFFNSKSKEAIFWRWFEKKSNYYLDFEKNQEFLFNDLKKELNKIHPYLVFEFGNKLDNGCREFVISADGIKSAFPFVQNLVKNAPCLKKWKIIAFRQPKKNITHVEYLNLSVSLDNVFFIYNEEHGKININLFFKDFYESAEFTAITFVLLDNILGEYYTELYLGKVEKQKLSVDNPEKLLPIRELLPIVKAQAIKQNN